MARIYDQMAIQIKGNTVAEATEIDVTYYDSDQIVHILGGGGPAVVVNAPGARYMVITWSMVVPTEYADSLLFLTRLYLECARVPYRVIYMGSGQEISGVGALLKPKNTAKVSTANRYDISLAAAAQAFG